MGIHIYQVTARVSSYHPDPGWKHGILWLTTVSAPIFLVRAASAEEAVTKAHLILACDHRDTDTRGIRLDGEVIRDDDRSDYTVFSYTATQEVK